MTNRELIERVYSNHSDAEYLRELQDCLNDELKKPVSEQDFDLIEDITEAIAVLNGTEQYVSTRTEQGIAKIKNDIQQQRRKKMRIRFGGIAACIAAVLIGTNVLSYSVYGQNVFSAATQVLKKEVVVDFSKQDSTSIEVGNAYEEDMRQICAEHNMDVHLPTYIPEGFEPTEYFIDFTELDCQKILSFYFKKGSKKLIFMAIQILTEEGNIPLGIPCDEHHVSEQVIDNTVVTVVKEDNQFNAVFMIDQVQYQVCSDGVDYDECQRVLESCFE